MVRDSVKFLVDTMLKNDIEKQEASTNTEEIQLSTNDGVKEPSYCLC